MPRLPLGLVQAVAPGLRAVVSGHTLAAEAQHLQTVRGRAVGGCAVAQHMRLQQSAKGVLQQPLPAIKCKRTAPGLCRQSRADLLKRGAIFSSLAAR